MTFGEGNCKMTFNTGFGMLNKLQTILHLQMSLLRSDSIRTQNPA